MENESGLPIQGDDEAVRGEDRASAGTPTGAVPSGANPTASASGRMEVSAQTIARMMGIASVTDLQLLEGRLDLLTSRVSTLMMKVDKVLAGLGAVASVGDIGRIETQIASIKSMLRDATDVVGALQSGQSLPVKETGESQGRKLREGIRTSSES